MAASGTDSLICSDDQTRDGSAQINSQANILSENFRGLLKRRTMIQTHIRGEKKVLECPIQEPDQDK